MKCRPLVSVIMPTYNCSKYVEEAIQSILNQTYSNLELIIVNDGSSDEGKTEEIIHKYNNVAVVIDKNNEGVAATLNIGLELAKGEYIARMDADDISHHMRIENQVEFLENNLNVDLVSSDYIAIDSEGRQVETAKGDVQNELCSEQIKAELIFGNPIIHPSVMFRRIIVDEGYKYSDQFIAEDYDLWTKLIMKYKMNIIPQKLLFYRTHGDNNTKKRRFEVYESVSRSTSRYIQQLWNIDMDTYSIYDTFHNEMSVPVCAKTQDFFVKQINLILNIYLHNLKMEQIDNMIIEEVLIKRLYWLSGLFGGRDFQHAYCGPDSMYEIIDAFHSRQMTFEELHDVLFYKSTIINQKLKYFREEKNKIILYGCGKRGKLFLENFDDLKSELGLNWNIIAICDKYNMNNNGYNKIDIISPDEISKVSFDYIVVSTNVFYKEIKSSLLNQGIDETKIVDCDYFL